MTRRRAVFELLFAAGLWGFGFVAAVWALTVYTAVETMVYRFIIATLVGEFIYLIARGPRLTTARADFFTAIPAGIFLGGMLLLQTIGLQYTSATKSGFITSLYVVLVPLLNTLVFKNFPHWKSYLLASLALCGTAMLVNIEIQNINPGDLWTLGCAIFAALHIIYIGKVTNKIGNAFRFNNFQSFWALVLAAPWLLTQSTLTVTTDSWKALVGLISLGVASSVIAFFLQIRSQRVLSDATASMLFLLESPFAALFGFILLGERLLPLQIAGAFIIMLSSSLQVLWVPATKTIEMKPQ